GRGGGWGTWGAGGGLRGRRALSRGARVPHAEGDRAGGEALGFPPAVRMAAVTGPAEAVAGFLAETALPTAAELIGTVPAAGAGGPGGAGQDRGQALIRIPPPGGLALAAALPAAPAARAARKEPGQVRVHLDPAELI